MGVRMFDLHASGSLAMMQQTVSEVNRICRNEQLRRPKILAVTVLTHGPADPQWRGTVIRWIAAFGHAGPVVGRAAQAESATTTNRLRIL